MQIRLVDHAWYFISNSIDRNVDKLPAGWRKIMGINRVAGQQFFLVTQNMKSNLYRLIPWFYFQGGIDVQCTPDWVWKIFELRQYLEKPIFQIILYANL